MSQHSIKFTSCGQSMGSVTDRKCYVMVIHTRIHRDDLLSMYLSELRIILCSNIDDLTIKSTIFLSPSYNNRYNFFDILFLSENDYMLTWLLYIKS